VADEPETYLHPDVQRQLLGIFRDIGADVVAATHSSEIISEADPSEIVLIDKRRRAGERPRDVVGVQRALDAVGSAQNITLTALSRSRRVLFVEGDDDFRLLRRFARRLGMQELAAGLGIIALPSGGFGSWERVTTLAAGIADALGAPLAISAIYDRDYYCSEQAEEVVRTLSRHLRIAYVHQRKEIENYLLVPDALDRASARLVEERRARDGVSGQDRPNISNLLLEITEPMKDYIFSHIMAKRAEYFRHTGRDLADINRETITWFNQRWTDLRERLKVVPGKDVLRSLRGVLQERFGISLTDSRIVESIRRDEIPLELQDLLKSLDEFRLTVV
jgi:hypothetical protein